MGIAAGLFATAAAAIVAVWAWLGVAVEMPQSPLGSGDKVYCVSYAPFRAGQSPFGPDVPIDPQQIDQDLAQLKEITNCVRTYSIDHGLDQIPEVAKRHGLKVMQGLWLSSLPDLSRKQIDGAVALAKRYPDVIQSVIVGNEVLLRGEMSTPQLASVIREVKAQVPQPVTYADVWEFWLRNRELASAVDFITVHILPYWEDVPIPAQNAARHVEAIRRQVADAFPGKEILIGEFGWPSAGRMREAALPSPANQALALHDVMATARRAGFHVNLIEAYDQPWKRQLEGAVGGHWGLFDAYLRKPKFVWGSAVSNHPNWRWHAAAGVGLAVMIFGASLAACRLRPSLPLRVWLGTAANTVASGVALGWTFEKAPVESLTAGDWTVSLAWAGVSVLVPVVGAAAAASDVSIPRFAALLGRGRRPDPLAFLLGALLIVLSVLAIQSALGLVFDPRYRDFPFAALTAAVVPYLVMTAWPRLRAIRVGAESVAAAVLALSAIYIVINESLANWQALWFACGLLVLAFILLPERDAPGSG